MFMLAPVVMAANLLCRWQVIAARTSKMLQI
jgi:hypothetical protein